MNGTTSAAVRQANGVSSGTRIGDDLLRSSLRIGDPASVDEVLAALRKRYPEEARKIDQEALGQPVVVEEPAAAPSPAAEGTTGSRELSRARENVDADLGALLRDRETSDWLPELTAHRDAILRELDDAADAAREAGDPSRLEAALLSTVRLADFARVARHVACYHVGANRECRRLAAALDGAASALRVVIGESMSPSSSSLRVPLSDARARADTLVLALEQLAGTRVAAAPGAARSYAALVRSVELGLNVELRPYLRGPELRRSVDALLASASSGADGLRGAAATAPLELAHLGRLLTYATAARLPQSRPLTAFAEALRQLVAAFAGATGLRLVDLALPAPVAATRVSTTAAGAAADRVLRAVVTWRPTGGREADAYQLVQPPGLAQLNGQRAADLSLWVFDRAVHHLSYGRRNADTRGAAFTFIAQYLYVTAAPGSALPLAYARLTVSPADMGALLPAAIRRRVVVSAVAELRAMDAGWQTLARRMAPRCFAIP